MPHPFQCLARVSPSSSDRKDFLLAACGPKLLCILTSDGSVASQWTSGTAGIIEVDNESNATVENGERPAKKQKISQKAPSALSNIIKLAVSPDQQHAIAVTEDKCIRVFDVDSNGVLAELSQRIMPKRPCGIKVLPDNETVICADKFGDVYSLPLLPVDAPEKNAEAVAQKETPEPVKPVFRPSATNLTVHSQRNLRALEAQQKQKLFAPRKEALAFEHKLLLGHVSMLTDVAFITREIEGRNRGYIITADRDEHIRVSRGPPQAHIIEGYCLAHKEFISKLCLIPKTDLLVSGGGDPWIGVWDWPSFALKQTVDIEQYVSKFVDTEDNKGIKIAISGLWAVPLEASTECHALIVTCEKIPALFIFTSSTLMNDAPSCTIVELGASPLDVSYSNERLVVFVDVRSDDKPRLLAYRINLTGTSTTHVELDAAFREVSLCSLNQLSGIEEDPKTIDSLLYGIENLRKRTGPGDEELEQD